MAGRVLSLLLPFLAAGSSNLRGDGNYVDTVQCTGSGTLPMQPVPWSWMKSTIWNPKEKKAMKPSLPDFCFGQWWPFFWGGLFLHDVYIYIHSIYTVYRFKHIYVETWLVVLNIKVTSDSLTGIVWTYTCRCASAAAFCWRALILRWWAMMATGLNT